MNVKEYQKAYYEKNKAKINEQRKANDKLYSAKYRAENKDKIKAKRDTKKDKANERSKQWNEANKDRIKERKKVYNKKYREQNTEYQKQYRDKNKTKLRLQIKLINQNRLKTDTVFRLRKNLRTHISTLIRQKGLTKNFKTEQILGCSYS